MDDNFLVLYVVLVFLFLLSAYFSSTETAFSAVSKVKLKHMAEGGNKSAERALKVANNFDQLLSTVLIGNNVVNIAASSIATFICVYYWGNLGVTLATIIMTVIVLIFGEISPKTLAKENPEKLAMFSAPIITALMVILKPINMLFSCWKKLILKVFKIEGSSSISEEELLTFVAEAREFGGININEETMIRQAIEFDELKTIDILTARVDVEGIEIDATKDEVTKTFYDSGFSRLPVYEESLDNTLGVLLLKDYFYNLEKGNDKIETMMRPAVFVPKTIKVSRLLIKLQESQSHLAIVVDEYGGTEGIVTIEDIIEELIGDIWDEYDEIVDEIETIGINKYRILGSTEIEDFCDLLEIDYDEDEVNSSTVGGWVAEELGRFPEEGEQYDIDMIHIEIVRVEKNRIEEIIATKL